MKETAMFWTSLQVFSFRCEATKRKSHSTSKYSFDILTFYLHESIYFRLVVYSFDLCSLFLFYKKKLHYNFNLYGFSDSNWMVKCDLKCLSCSSSCMGVEKYEFVKQIINILLREQFVIFKFKWKIEENNLEYNGKLNAGDLYDLRFELKVCVCVFRFE